jgi:hypothetical protein
MQWLWVLLLASSFALFGNTGSNQGSPAYLFGLLLGSFVSVYIFAIVIVNLRHLIWEYVGPLVRNKTHRISNKLGRIAGSIF